MKHFALLLLLFPLILSAQTVHDVEVGGSTVGGTPPYFEPQNLVIDLGDIVVWTNVSGTHNVNGSTIHFPDNPESFSSGAAQSGNWTFEYTFTVPGVYNYHCTQLGHSDTQFGTITVMNTSSIEESSDQPAVILFPSPTADLLIVEMGTQQLDRLEVLGLDGRVIRSISVNGANRIEISTVGMATGQYYLRSTDRYGRAMTRSFLKE